ncbi:MAG TPA: glycosyltransferase [Chthoniobacterales bacterium]|nr:glycosyltransferase [Chthoniobacterales bacterium]
MNDSPDPRPVVALYCATFLKPEMLHIFRQITGLQRVRPVVIGQKRENPETFPFEKIDIIEKPATHFLRRFWSRQICNKPWQLSAREAEAITAVLSRESAQLLHIFFGHIAVHLLPLIRKFSKPRVVSFHGADVLVDMDKPAYRKATSEMLRLVTRVFVRSASLQRAVVELGCDENKIDIVRTGIPLREFSFREREFPSDGKWHFLQASRLVQKKGIATTLHAFTRFLNHYPDATLTIAGEGPMSAELKELTRKLKIADRVKLPGFLPAEKLRGVYYASHIFLHPSETGSDGNQEGIPNSMLEAMATGLPVFATDHGGIPEAIENGVSGILVAERDYEALSRVLIEAVQDRDFLKRLARNGAKVVAEKFDQRKQIERLEEIYLGMIRNSRKENR